MLYITFMILFGASGASFVRCGDFVFPPAPDISFARPSRGYAARAVLRRTGGTKGDPRSGKIQGNRHLFGRIGRDFTHVDPRLAA